MTLRERFVRVAGCYLYTIRQVSSLVLSLSEIFYCKTWLAAWSHSVFMTLDSPLDCCFKECHKVVQRKLDSGTGGLHPPFVASRLY